MRCQKDASISLHSERIQKHLTELDSVNSESVNILKVNLFFFISIEV